MYIYNIYYILFNCLPRNIHVDCFHPLAVINVTTNTGLTLFVSLISILLVL